MKEFWQKVIRKMMDPPVWFLIVWYVLTTAAIAGSIVMLFVEYKQSALEYVAYALFALAAVTLAYTVYTLVRFTPKIKRAVIGFLERYSITRAIIHDYGHRTIIFAVGTFFMSVAFGAFNAYLGIVSKSIWYGALAAYYILLAVIRGGILGYHKKHHAGKAENPALQRAKRYKTSGWLLLLLNAALSSAIAQMIFEDRFFSYADWTVLAMAAYAFFKITMSIINLFKARKQDDLTVEAIRNINLMDAAVSILALQTALLNAFQTGDVNVSLFNTGTGIVVSLVTLAIGVYMIVKGNKTVKEIRREKYHGK